MEQNRKAVAERYHCSERLTEQRMEEEKPRKSSVGDPLSFEIVAWIAEKVTNI
jgi:hypothetical protein